MKTEDSAFVDALSSDMKCKLLKTYKLVLRYKRAKQNTDMRMDLTTTSAMLLEKELFDTLDQIKL